MGAVTVGVQLYATHAVDKMIVSCRATHGVTLSALVLDVPPIPQLPLQCRLNVPPFRQVAGSLHEGRMP